MKGTRNALFSCADNNLNSNICQGFYRLKSEYYKDKYNSTSSDTLVVSVNTLKNNGYLTSIKDEKNKDCIGYAKILNNGTCVSYIKCSKYKTSRYDSDYE